MKTHSIAEFQDKCQSHYPCHTGPSAHLLVNLGNQKLSAALKMHILFIHAAGIKDKLKLLQPKGPWHSRKGIKGRDCKNVVYKVTQTFVGKTCYSENRTCAQLSK